MLCLDTQVDKSLYLET